MKRFCVVSLFLLCLVVPLTVVAQSPDVERGQAFRDLSNDAVVMDISAHPDDEDGATLALYRMKYGVKTYSVLFTRGEGGQNEIGPELYEDLGVIRSRETRRAGAILGTSVVFLDFMDFGFSKTATETFRVWGGQMEPLRRLVYVIRKYKPDILFTNHNTIDGHGHHQAAAITAIAAFDAAADPRMFPEQLKEAGVDLWQPRKLFFRAFGHMAGPPDVSNQVDQVDSLRGRNYLDIATEALRQHRTQGMENANLRAFTRGKSLYKLMRTNSLYESDSTSFLSGIDLWRDPTLQPLLPIRRTLSALRPEMPMDSLLSVASRCEREIDLPSRDSAGSPLARRLTSLIPSWFRDRELRAKCRRAPPGDLWSLLNGPSACLTDGRCRKCTRMSRPSMASGEIGVIS
jgi:LmbE family N-acetylglucosaminyl deacetylase